MATHPATPAAPPAEAVYRRIGWRIIPFLILCYFVAYLDRVNIGFAQLQMKGDLHFSDAVYGLGAGIFFLGYFLFEVPSNLILHRVGARVWIARIMITWGLISALTLFVTTPTQFYVMRFLLGVAEAGFFPGIILYLTYWYPAARRSQMTAWFMSAVPLSGLIGGPVSGWILHHFHGQHGWAGWQWLFVLEGLPAVVLGIVTLFYLDNGIKQAKWLNADEKNALQHALDQEAQTKPAHSALQGMADPRVWLMALIYFSVVIGLYGLSFWLPLLIKSTGVTDPLTIGWLVALPYGVSVVAMILVGRSSDKRHERRWHVAIPALIGAVGLVLSTLWSTDTTLAMVALTLATVGIMVVLPLFWALPNAFLAGTAAAAGIALINALGNLAGFFGPSIIGWVKQATQSTNGGILVLAAFMVLCAVLVLLTPKTQK
ncbi:MAG: MFS transporter [Thiomonas arsenitoxydans]|uniref:Putative tartrate transporter n=1 Tax=Thiomonas arsenitoxydans (strain DSM 22701 / CIP 110005 / 3As) TaxID=426114 RepID=A0A8I1MXX1_THIA3|nr:MULTISPECIES: MFS transporter [Thiomonas]MBN8744364.1 MFS transporter [Thiomonas arsenitoxydans]ODU96712.1 MAG: MFS transporter [Thiomonas sp. SCN 64-16]